MVFTYFQGALMAITTITSEEQQPQGLGWTWTYSGTMAKTHKNKFSL